MAVAEYHEVMKVEMDALWKVITQYESYPEFVDGCKKTKVNRSNPANVIVDYDVSMMKDISYRLSHEEDRSKGYIRWNLVQSDFFKVNKGSWELKSAGAGKTDIYYRVEIDFSIPVPGFILNRLVKGSLPSMVKSFVERAKDAENGG